MIILEYFIIGVSTILTLVGVFHQLIVGGIVTRLIDAEEKDLRLYLMSWISHGNYITFLGILPIILFIFHSSYDPALKTTFFILAIAMIILSIHIAISGLKYKILPITLEFVLLIISSGSILLYYFLI
ncbi:MAG: hypothetical protein ACK4UJ_03380 [Leptonema sp. (in: bacteria)]